MGRIKFSPGNSCCEDTCPIFEDDFNRADSTSLGADWTETAGAWEIVSNELTTASANAELTTAASVPVTQSGVGKVTMRIKATASGDIICIGDKSGGSQVLFTFKFGTGSYVGTKYLSADESRDAYTLNTNTWYSVEIGNFVKIDGNIIRVNYASGLVGTVKFNPFSIGTTTLSGSAYFDDIVISDFTGASDECPDYTGSCGWFNTDPPPASVTLDIVGAGAAGLYDYTNLNGTYSLNSLGNCNYRVSGLSINITDSTGSPRTINRIDFLPFADANVSRAYVDTDVTRYYQTDQWSTAGDPLLGDSNSLTLNPVAFTTGAGTATVSY